MSDETKNKPALEDNFAELEDILKQMEQPEISLEQSFLLYQSGVEKLKECIWRSRYGYQSGNRQTYR